jgi:outer membrane receptor for monomeric catechols
VGGVINRATRQADWNTANEVMLQAGSHTNRRLSVDLTAVDADSAARLTDA